jgi:hypothetical protein
VTGRWELKDEQWAVVEPVLRPIRRADNDTRAVLNGVLWFWEPGHSGARCRRNILRTRRAIAGSSSGCGPTAGRGAEAADSDPLDRRLHEEYGIEMIAPNRRNRSSSQDGRKTAPLLQ